MSKLRRKSRARAGNELVDENHPPSKRGAFARAGAAVLDLLFAPEPAARLMLFQRLFTSTFAFYLFGWAQHAREWLTDAGYHISPETTDSVYPMPFPLVPEIWLLPFLFGMFGICGLGILGWGGRITRVALCALAIYIQLVDQPSSFTLNKIYIAFFFLLAIAPSAQDFMDDDGERRAFISAWPIRMIQGTLVIQYCTAGICKAVWGDWLTRIDILYTHSIGLYRTEIAALFIRYTPLWGWTILGWSALLFELFAPLVFLIRRLRPVGILWGIGFHLVVALMMKDLIYFSIQLISVYVLFLPPALTVRIEDRIRNALFLVERRIWPARAFRSR